jgi:hypothetical protein
MPRKPPPPHAHLTNETCTPRLRWMPAQARQMYTPYGTDAQVGFLAGQSKHTCGGRVHARRGAARIERRFAAGPRPPSPGGPHAATERDQEHVVFVKGQSHMGCGSATGGLQQPASRLAPARPSRR